jgi:hypothetical protein
MALQTWAQEISDHTSDGMEQKLWQLTGSAISQGSVL